jgi:tripartite-type tricarboxylate transporter receptor subunit TctC
MRHPRAPRIDQHHGARRQCAGPEEKNVKSVLRNICVVLLIAAACPALAQSAWPNRPVRVIVPSAPGGAPDVMARLYAQKLTENLGQPFVVENITGAAGIVGTDKVAKSANDGYTLMFGFNQLVTTLPHLYAKLPYDPNRDLTPVIVLAYGPYVWLANNNAPFNNIAELIAYAKANPGKVAYGSIGAGTATHLGGELLAQQAGIDLLHVPYKGRATSDLMAGQIQLALEPNGSAVPFVKDGRVKAIAVASAKRLPALPNVPTVGETLPGYEVSGWQAIWLPGGASKEMVERLNAEFAKVIRDPAFNKRLLELSYIPVANTPAEMSEMIRQETLKWGALIKAKNIHLD